MEFPHRLQQFIFLEKYILTEKKVFFFFRYNSLFKVEVQPSTLRIMFQLAARNSELQVVEWIHSTSQIRIHLSGS